MQIEKFVHRCVGRDGPAAGNKIHTPVDRYDVEYGGCCDHCGEPLATVEQITLHIYEQLTE